MTRIRIAPLALVALLALAACSAAPTTTAETTPDAMTPFDGSHVDVDTWAEATASEGVIIVDVRTPEEYAGGHIPGAVNVDLNSGSFESDIAALDSDAPLAVYCHSGNRSRQAVGIMATLGITQTLGLDGGIDAWTAAGHAVTTD